MISINYERLASLIDNAFEIYREDDFVYLLYPNPPQNSNIIFQEMDPFLIVWSNEYKSKSMLEVYQTICEEVEVDLLFPYIESEEELQAVLALGATPINFTVEDDDTLCKEYGSYYVRKER